VTDKKWNKYGHSGPKNDKDNLELFQLLKDHCHGVQTRGEAFLPKTHPAREEFLAAFLLHDGDKAGPEFFKRLEGKRIRLDHSSGMAAWFLKHNLWFGGMVIEHHHMDLPDHNLLHLRHLMEMFDDWDAWWQGNSDRKPTHDGDMVALLAELERQGILVPDLSMIPKQILSNRLQVGLDLRVGYSCLIDADWKDTAAHASGKKEWPPLVLNAAELLQCILDYIEILKKEAEESGACSDIVFEERQKLLKDALAAADKDVGIFTCTAATGTGKTMALMAFAAKHAVKHGLKRVVYAAPYLAIIDQTAEEFRKAFASKMPRGYMIEHHTNAMKWDQEDTSDAHKKDYNEDDWLRRKLAQAWDAPVVLTSNVQMLETLFSNKRARCRKIHNMCDAVYVLDECQSLPLGIVLPTLATLSYMSHQYNCTFAFGTATQPAFDSLDRDVQRLEPSGWKPTEICSTVDESYKRLKRVDFNFHIRQNNGKWEWIPKTEAAIAREVVQKNQCLIVLNRKDLARNVYNEIEKLRGDSRGLFLYNTDLCGLHRQHNLKEIKRRLDPDVMEPCFLVTTQSIEAGVDISFPEGFRQNGPLPSLIQVAGRVNRGGGLTCSILHVVQFNLDEKDLYPFDDIYIAMSKLTSNKILASGNPNLDIAVPSVVKSFYENLYRIQDKCLKTRKLVVMITKLMFESLAKEYRIIKHKGVNIVVPYGEAKPRFDELLAEVESPDWDRRCQEKDGWRVFRNWRDKAKELTISFPVMNKVRKEMVLGQLKEVTFKGESTGWYICDNSEWHDDKTGFKPDEGPFSGPF
jgi:CRISPR-associated endonuclease/helicase Cas3